MHVNQSDKLADIELYDLLQASKGLLSPLLSQSFLLLHVLQKPCSVFLRQPQTAERKLKSLRIS